MQVPSHTGTLAHTNIRLDMRPYVDSKVHGGGAPDGSDAGGGQHGLHRMDAVRQVT